MNAGSLQTAPVVVAEQKEGTGVRSDEFVDDEAVTTDRFDLVDGKPVSLSRTRGVLMCLDGAAAGRIISVGDRDLLVGRDPTADVHLADTSASRRHARIERRGQVFWVEDLSSRNGTFVNGRPVGRLTLHDGDLVQFGQQASFRFSLIDERQEAVLQRLYASSVHDPLTGVYNRGYAEERLGAEIAYATRHKTNLAVVLFDVDHFKQVNDTYGHAAGDVVLKCIASVMQRQLRTEDVVARFGGEEFVVLLRNIDLLGAGAAGERVRTAIMASPAPFPGVPAGIRVTISGGGATLACCERPSREEMFALADRRLYQAKRGGRNRIVVTEG